MGTSLYVAGQGGFDAKIGQLVGEGTKEQTRQTLQNLKYVVDRQPYPARITVSAGREPGMKVEIDGITVLPE